MLPQICGSHLNHFLATREIWHKLLLLLLDVRLPKLFLAVFLAASALLIG